MGNDRQEIFKLLESGFSMPDFPGDPGREIDYQLALIEASNAVNEHDPEFRAQMASAVAEKLLDGSPLLIPERAWLIYVLKKIGVQKLPNEHKGRAPTPPMDRLVDMCKLGVAMLEEEQSHATVTARLRAAGLRLGMSYESVRQLYYSKGYKAFSKRSSFQRICRENAIVNK